MCDTTNNTNEQNDKSLDNLKDLYKRYCDCRDQELERFWKNSTFVWCFLTLCFTAYGLLISKFIDIDNLDCKLFKTQLFISCICCLGIICSLVWKWMSMGLKGWFEVYEIAIWDMESYNNIFNYEKKYAIENYWVSKNNLLSPSKIVILIGQCVMIFWICAIGVNFIVFFINNCCFILAHIIMLAFIIVFVYKAKKYIKSSSLRNEEQQTYFEEVRNEMILNKICYKYLEIKESTRMVFEDYYYHSNWEKLNIFLNTIKNKYEKEIKKYPIVIELINDSYSVRDYNNELK